MTTKLPLPARLIMTAAIFLMLMVCFTATALGMQVFVINTSGQSMTYEVEPGETILSLKNKVFDKEGIDPVDQQLTFAGGQLADDQTLADYNIQRGSSLSLSLKTADYSAVDAAIARAGALNRSDYSNFDAVDAAIAAVTRGKLLSSQTDVDAMAAAISNAIAALKPVDDATPSDPGDDPLTDPTAENSGQTGNATEAVTAGDPASSAPATGDGAGPLLWTSAFGAALGCLMYVGKRRNIIT